MEWIVESSNSRYEKFVDYQTKSRRIKMASTYMKRVQRLQSMMDVFLDACNIWANFSNDDDLAMQIDKAKQDIEAVDIEKCDDTSISSMEDMTSKILGNMDVSLKASGFSGLIYKGIRH